MLKHHLCIFAAFLRFVVRQYRLNPSTTGHPLVSYPPQPTPPRPRPHPHPPRWSDRFRVSWSKPTNASNGGCTRSRLPAVAQPSPRHQGGREQLGGGWTWRDPHPQFLRGERFWTIFGLVTFLVGILLYLTITYVRCFKDLLRMEFPWRNGAFSMLVVGP